MNMSEGTNSTTTALWDHFLSSYYILVFIIAVPGNVSALWVFCHQNKMSPSKIFLRNLSITDLLYILILPMRIIYHFSGRNWPFGHTLCKLSGFLFYLNMYCSLYLMSFISFDRLLAVVLPLRSRSVRKPLFAKVAVCILWVIITLSMSPTLFSKENKTNSSSTCNKLYLEITSSSALISTVVAFSIPFTTIIVSYILILLKVRKLKHQDERPVRDKAVKMIILILINFFVAFVPYHVSRVIYIQSHSHGHLTAASQDPLRKANQITSALTCISGVLDPLMYFFSNRGYKDMFLKVFCKNRL